MNSLDNGSRFLSCLVYPESGYFTGFPGYQSESANKMNAGCEATAFIQTISRSGLDNRILRLYLKFQNYFVIFIGIR